MNDPKKSWEHLQRLAKTSTPSISLDEYLALLESHIKRHSPKVLSNQVLSPQWVAKAQTLAHQAKVTLRDPQVQSFDKAIVKAEQILKSIRLCLSLASRPSPAKMMASISEGSSCLVCARLATGAPFYATNLPEHVLSCTDGKLNFFLES